LIVDDQQAAETLDQARRIAVAFARETARSASARMCAACVEVLDVTGAGITVMAGDQAGPICVSSPRIAALEDLQYTTGQGPCRDAFQLGRSVHAPRLGRDIWERWPTFVDLAQATGIGAVFAYPMTLAGARVGVLTLYQNAEGDLTALQQDDSLVLADIITETVLGLQDDAPDGTLSGSLEGAVQYRAQIYQASGMVAIQLSISAADALLRIRAHAFATDSAVADVAADIVSRRLQLTSDDHPLQAED